MQIYCQQLNNIISSRIVTLNKNLIYYHNKFPQNLIEH